MDKKIKVALIGYGYWGKILEKYLLTSNFILKKIYSPTLKKEGYFTNIIEEVIKDQEIEAVFLATPVETHYKLCKIFLENKKHVFCEKPMVKTQEEAFALKKISQKYDKVLETNYIYLDSSSIKLMRKKKSEIGPIEYIEGEISQFGNFYKNDDVFSTIGCHFLSVLYYLFEKKENKVSAKSKLKDLTGNIIGGSLNLEFDDFNVDFNFNLKSMTKRRIFTLYGKNGIIIFNMLDEQTLRVIKLENNTIIDTQSYSFDENNNLSKALKRFENVIKKRNKSNLDLSINITRLLEEIKNVIS